MILQLITVVDYRVPQMLRTLGCLRYSPRLDNHIRQLQPIRSGDTWEIELRGKSCIVFSPAHSALFQSCSTSYLVFTFQSYLPRINSGRDPFFHLSTARDFRLRFQRLCLPTVAKKKEFMFSNTANTTTRVQHLGR